MSCTQHYQNVMKYKDAQLGDHQVPVSDMRNFKNWGSTTHNMNHTASAGDRIFLVQSVVGESQKDTDKCCNTFSSVQPAKLHQISKENPDGYLKEAIGMFESKHGHIDNSVSETTDKEQKEQVSSQASFKGFTSQDDIVEKTQEKQYEENERNQSALSYEPFTNLQQVQLRAQIFVYGSLIRWVPPDEGYMISAFGETDGGRSIWEKSWVAASERFQNQKAHCSSSETPLHSHPASNCSYVHNKVHHSPAVPSCSKVVSSTVLTTDASMSPLWNLSSHDDLLSNTQKATNKEHNLCASHLLPYQSMEMRTCTSIVPPWTSQTPDSWASSTAILTHDTTAQHPTMSFTETVPVKAAKDSSLCSTTNEHLVAPAILPANHNPLRVSAASVTTAEGPEMATSFNIENQTTGVKSTRKRKKVSIPEQHMPVCTISQSQPESASVITQVIPSSAGLSLSGDNPNNVASAVIVPFISNTAFPSNVQMIGSGDTKVGSVFMERTTAQNEQSKLEAENDSALAASAMSYCQEIWNQLTTSEKPSLASEVDNILSSAAVAAAAAASVAKAAAAAAKIASEAAYKAKMLADEILNSFETQESTQSSLSKCDLRKGLTMLTSVSVLNGKDHIYGSSSIISAAREVAQKRVESASTAKKQAENLESIMKAAELVAEAVSQSGIIIAMGDPVSFSIDDLVKVGSEACEKIHHNPISNSEEKNNCQEDKNVVLDIDQDHDEAFNEFNMQQCHKERQKLIPIEKMTSDQPVRLDENITDGKLRETSHSLNCMRSSGIKKGSFVEIATNEDGLKGVWFAAWVLDIRDGKAYISYKNLLDDEGTGQLKEWIPIDHHGEEAPRIRIAHPLTLAETEGTKKRRREATKNYAWTVGDRVDAWICDGWWEGIVTGMCEGDDTKLNVYFPAGGDSSMVRTWNLRPSLIWKAGEWTQCISGEAQSFLDCYEGDTPNEKRQKPCELEAKRNTEMNCTLLKNTQDDDLCKFAESRSTNLLLEDNMFHIGKNNQESKKNELTIKCVDRHEEPRVVVGVPKPGKIKKLTEVNKHFSVAKSDMLSDENFSIKSRKSLIPQPSQLWKNTPKPAGKEMQITYSRTRGFKSSKSQRVQTKEDNLFASENTNVPKTTSMQSVSDSKSSKKTLVGAIDAGTKEKQNALPSISKLRKPEIQVSKTSVNTTNEVVGPRKSNRITQPSSRLLEGLQSSLSLSKIPSVSRGKDGVNTFN